MEEDLYKILGINSKAHKKDIKKAYREKAKIHHPDHKGNSNDFSKISIAYSVLINDEKRKFYDKTGQIDLNTQDKAKKIAYDRLCQLFLEIVTKRKDSIFKEDVFAFLRKIISHQIDQCKNSMQDVEQEEKYLKKLKKRIKCKEKRINIFKVVIEEKIKTCRLTVSQRKFDLKILAEMKIILNDFRFDYDKAERSFYRTVDFRTTATSFDW